MTAQSDRGKPVAKVMNYSIHFDPSYHISALGSEITQYQDAEASSLAIFNSGNRNK